MPNYHRYYIPNSIIFITSVTKDRKPYLQSSDDIDTFLHTLEYVNTLYPFHLLAYVIMPDHFHWLMNVVNSQGNYSPVIGSIKRNFTLNFKSKHDIHTPFTLWQPRFWDHVIRDERDLETHIDYIHWNPVKHGFVNNPDEWKYSTFRFWYDRGYYPGMNDNSKLPKMIAVMDYE